MKDSLRYWVTLLVGVATLTSLTLAEDVVIDGVTYRNVQWGENTDQQIKMKWDGGEKLVPFIKLSDAMQKKYHFGQYADPAHPLRGMMSFPEDVIIGGKLYRDITGWWEINGDEIEIEYADYTSQGDRRGRFQKVPIAGLPVAIQKRLQLGQYAPPLSPQDIAKDIPVIVDGKIYHCVKWGGKKTNMIYMTYRGGGKWVPFTSLTPALRKQLRIDDPTSKGGITSPFATSVTNAQIMAMRKASLDGHLGVKTEETSLSSLDETIKKAEQAKDGEVIKLCFTYVQNNESSGNGEYHIQLFSMKGDSAGVIYNDAAQPTVAHWLKESSALQLYCEQYRKWLAGPKTEKRIEWRYDPTYGNRQEEVLIAIPPPRQPPGMLRKYVYAEVGHQKNEKKGNDQLILHLLGTEVRLSMGGKSTYSWPR